MAAYRLAFLLAPLLLAACGQGEKEAQADLTEEDVAAMLATVALEPGQWEAQTRIVSADGLPAAARARLVGHATTSSSCISPEQADRPNATFLAAQANSDCTYHSFTIDNGRLDARMTCSGGQLPGRMQTLMSGRYAPDGYDLTVTMRTADLPGGAAVEIKSRSVGKRTGEC